MLATETTMRAKSHDETNASHVIVTAILFAFFCFAVLLPLLFSVCEQLYAAIQIQMPGATALFVVMSPSVLFSLAIVTSILLLLVQINGSMTTIRRVGWCTITGTALLTTMAVFSFVSPLMSAFGWFETYQ